MLKITLAVKVYADGDISRSMFDDLLGEDAFYSLFDSENDSCRSRVFQDIGQAEIVAIPENTKLIVVSHRTVG